MRFNIFPILLPMMILTDCNPKDPNSASGSDRVPMVICFDVEDYTSPASAGMDDIPKWLAEIMTEEGVTGSFFVIGEKARMLEKRGRKDVIEAMAKHDIGSHTNYGSIHPTVTEILEHASWNEGVETMYDNESKGFADLERIFGQRPANLARHGGSYGPQLAGALSSLNAGYVYSPVCLPGHNAVWFCNALNFHGEGNYGFFDDAYHDDALFEPMLEALDSLIPRSIQDMDAVAFFANHPSKIRSIQFWDFNYYKGANPGPPEWKTPELRPLESMSTAQKNFRRLIRYLKERKDIELTTFRALAERFAGQEAWISRADLAALAERILEEERLIIAERYAPAELFAALAQSLDHYRLHRQLPERVAVRRPLGPAAMPLTDPEIKRITADGVLTLAALSRNAIESTGHLPSNHIHEGKKIGAGSLMALFAECYVDLIDSKPAKEFPVRSFEPYPSFNAKAIIQNVEDCRTWPVHREDLDMSHLVEMTKLQLWTLKPALPAAGFGSAESPSAI